MRFIIGISAIFVLLTSGCVIGSSNFFEGREKHLGSSSTVGCKKQLFRQEPTVKYDFNSKEGLNKCAIVNGTWEIENGKLSAVAEKKNRR